MKTVIRSYLQHPILIFYFLLIVVLSGFAIAIDGRTIIVASEIIDNPSNWRSIFYILVAMMSTVTVLNLITSLLDSKFINRGSTMFISDFTDKILAADVTLYINHSAADIQRVSDFSWNLIHVGKLCRRFILNISQVVIMIVYIYMIAKRFMIPIILVNVFTAILLNFTFKKWNKLDEICTESKKKRYQEFENCIQGFMERLTFNRTNWHRNRFNEYNEMSYQAYQNRGKINSMIGVIFDLSFYTSLVVIVIYGIYAIPRGLSTAAEVMVLVSFINRILNPLDDIVDFFSELSKELALSQQYDKIMNFKNSDDGRIKLIDFNDSIELDHVDFSYGDSREVLKDISIKINKGSKVGICGVSGGGKSTLFKLLNRFYKVSNGEIRIDGFNINDLTLESYRNIIGCVNQENYIFPGSIRENIVYGVNSYTEEEFIDACKKANIYDFAMSLEDKFDSIVGPRGLKLSGGQKQRIALARLLMKDSKIILLDEATSALDNESEFLIKNSIQNLGNDKTVISIAHRLTTIKNCDVIYVIGSNKILEEGTHEELLAKRGEYYRMWTINQQMEKGE